ncbi:hypothetical protein [Methanosphaera cuniculi]|uniref:Uncharacterized protein n=1 Tax=Methanosphaera cuniculi TaxID=1077256 RepID=A0A2A2HE83_9EURY|nr:hypothetical protein [Methanosphaera cuniculi]PAV07616.1 hypothetical protein ASJ82_08040 [Methanosphaera cuniculi]PWL08060.1 hypothetical protein MSCUN_09910 [Methanosphaera cuniculi]
MAFEDLLCGTNEQVPIYIEATGTTENVRKINVAETKNYRRIINKALGTINTTERTQGRRSRGTEAVAKLNLADTSEAEYDANVYLIKCSFNIDGQKINEKDITERLPNDVFDELVTKLKKLNSLDDDVNLEDEVKKL